jgi:hypothetical protein
MKVIVCKIRQLFNDKQDVFEINSSKSKKITLVGSNVLVLKIVALCPRLQGCRLATLWPMRTLGLQACNPLADLISRVCGRWVSNPLSFFSEVTQNPYTSDAQCACGNKIINALG